MTRARTVQVFLAMLAAALLVLQVSAQTVRGAQKWSAEPVAAQAQTVSECGHVPPQPEEAAGQFWHRNRLDAQPDPTAETATPPHAAPAALAPDTVGARLYGGRGAPGDRTPAVLQVFRC